MKLAVVSTKWWVGNAGQVSASSEGLTVTLDRWKNLPFSEQELPALLEAVTNSSSRPEQAVLLLPFQIAVSLVTTVRKPEAK